MIEDAFRDPLFLSFTFVALNQLRCESAKEKGTAIAQNAAILLTSVFNCQIAILHNSVLKHNCTRLIDRYLFVTKFGEEVSETTARVDQNFLTSTPDIIP